MRERLMAMREAVAICREIMRQYKFEDDIAYGARLCSDEIERQIRELEKDLKD